jgi:hypothetical protein
MGELKTIGAVLYYSGMLILLVGFVVLLISLAEIVSGLSATIRGMYFDAGMGHVGAPEKAPESQFTGVYAAIDYILWPVGVVVDNAFYSSGIVSPDNDIQMMFFPRMRRFFMLLATGFLIMAIGTLLKVTSDFVDFIAGRGRKARLRDQLMVRQGIHGSGSSSSDDSYYSPRGEGGGGRAEIDSGGGSSGNDYFLLYAVVGLVLLMVIGSLPLFMLPHEEAKGQISAIAGQCGEGYRYVAGACEPIPKQAQSQSAPETVPSESNNGGRGVPGQPPSASGASGAQAQAGGNATPSSGAAVQAARAGKPLPAIAPLAVILIRR